MSERPSGSLVVASLSGLALGALRVRVRGNEDDDVSLRLMQEGGVWSSAVLASAGLACFVGAILLGRSVWRGGRRRSPSAAFCGSSVPGSQRSQSSLVDDAAAQD
jgi:MFS family permease